MSTLTLGFLRPIEPEWSVSRKAQETRQRVLAWLEDASRIAPTDPAVREQLRQDWERFELLDRSCFNHWWAEHFATHVPYLLRQADDVACDCGHTAPAALVERDAADATCCPGCAYSTVRLTFVDQQGRGDWQTTFTVRGEAA